LPPPLHTLQYLCPQCSQTMLNLRVRVPHLQHLIEFIFCPSIPAPRHVRFPHDPRIRARASLHHLDPDGRERRTLNTCIPPPNEVCHRGSPSQPSGKFFHSPCSQCNPANSNGEAAVQPSRYTLTQLKYCTECGFPYRRDVSLFLRDSRFDGGSGATQRAAR
jgi:hypothetical protein